VWAWGNGSGGKLGLGDNKDRYEPCIVPTLRAKAIVQVRVLVLQSRGGADLAAVLAQRGLCTVLMQLLVHIPQPVEHAPLQCTTV
jgi:hypothetical protein